MRQFVQLSLKLLDNLMYFHIILPEICFLKAIDDLWIVFCHCKIIHSPYVSPWFILLIVSKQFSFELKLMLFCVAEQIERSRELEKYGESFQHYRISSI